MSGQHVEGERGFQILRAGVQQQIGHRAADVVHHDVEAGELVDRRLRECRGGLGVGEVGDDDVSATAQATDLFGDVIQLACSARRDDDVGADLREGDRDGRAETAPGSRDYCYLIVESASVEYHP